MSNIEMQDVAALMRQNQEDVEHAEGGCGDGKEIHRDQVPGMGVEEGLPGLIGAPGSGAILADGRIGDCNCEFGQFGLDAPAAPGGIAGPHSTNEGDAFAVKGGSAATGTRFPPPEKAKSQTMPSD